MTKTELQPGGLFVLSLAFFLLRGHQGCIFVPDWGGALEGPLKMEEAEIQDGKSLTVPGAMGQGGEGCLHVPSIS